MPKQGRFAGAVLPAKGLKSITTGQKGQVDVVTLGMVADGAFHGIPPESVVSGSVVRDPLKAVSGFRFSVKSVQLSAVSGQQKGRTADFPTLGRVGTAHRFFCYNISK